MCCTISQVHERGIHCQKECGRQHFLVEEYLLHQMVYIHAASFKHLLMSLQVTLRIYLVKVIVLFKIHKLQQRPA